MPMTGGLMPCEHRAWQLRMYLHGEDTSRSISDFHQGFIPRVSGLIPT